MSSFEAELEALKQMSLQYLRLRWKELQGQEPPTRISLQLMRLAIAYALQERAYGGLSQQTKLRLKSLDGQSHRHSGVARVSKRAGSLRSTIQFKPGTRFLREWQGQTHEVTLLEDGKFVHGGKAHRSLTAIARAITGTHQSGPTFFGVVKRSVQEVLL